MKNEAPAVEPSIGRPKKSAVRLALELLRFPIAWLVAVALALGWRSHIGGEFAPVVFILTFLLIRGSFGLLKKIV